MKKKYSLSKLTALYEEVESERSEYMSEYMEISDYLLPGRGIYQRYSKPRKRKLTSPKVINTIAEDSLYVLTSGIHGGLTSPSRPWYKNEWSDPQIQAMDPMKAWMEDSTKRQHAGFHASNFYSVMNGFYIELVGFGTSCMYVGEDSATVQAPFRFELLTAGEYAYSMGSDGRLDTFFRTIFMTPRQLVQMFPKTASKKCKKMVKDNESGVDTSYITIMEYVAREPYRDKPITRLYYEVTGSGTRSSSYTPAGEEPLLVDGFYEFPYIVARWSTIGSDIYGIGPGSRALPDIKRLQEMEKAFLMATHKNVNPPLNAPGRMRGKINSLPGGMNYYANPAETVNELYQVRFDYTGVGGAVERVEQRIQRNFFNDIFLTAARDPNATPYKATEVNAREQEKMLRLGPVIERLQHEFLQPLVERCFNIMLRKDLFAPLSPELGAIAGDYTTTLVSPLATAQRAVALQGIQGFMGFIGQAAQLDQTILDNIDPDAAAREYADITGVEIGVLRPIEEVQALRENRAKQMAAEKQKQEQMAMAGMKSQMNAEQATAQKAQSEAGLNMLEGQQIAQDMGMM